ncbi:MAG: ABC transporter permease [Mycobacteriales bacterium]
MKLLAATLRWFTDSAHWSGADGIPYRLGEHLLITATAVLIASVIAIPLGVLLGHRGRGGFLAINVSNIGRAIPTFAVLVLFAASPIGFGNRATVIALAIFALPPVLTNTYVGMRGVDPDVRESAVGMGMTRAQLIRRVELPLARPLVLTGLRTSTVQVVATATLAAVVGGGGLGRFVVDGFGQQDQVMLLAGALLVAGLSLAVELAMGAVQRAVTPGRRTALDRPGAAALATDRVAVAAPTV